MKTAIVNNTLSTVMIAEDRLTASTIDKQIMKKLANTSPFLLLLVPVFMMIILTLTVNTNQNDEIVVKPAKTSTAIVKQATAIFQ
ncbi:hypothetical protein [Pedobacter sp. BMA]|uniref:hypothetical protein n=1 Tax=Pedobacter sp. BMA TaxID=1663685 RepID=UPI000649BD8F|nr:hypothetical protein [Pedobacter sp. BMA]KLT64902.1 hypothetical protein AB669_14340 [Pedobacter sp. BMA]